MTKQTVRSAVLLLTLGAIASGAHAHGGDSLL